MLKTTYLSTIWYLSITWSVNTCICVSKFLKHTLQLLPTCVDVHPLSLATVQSINATSVAQGVVLTPLKKSCHYQSKSFRTENNLWYIIRQKLQRKIEVVLLYMIQDYYSSFITRAILVLGEDREFWKGNLRLHIWRLQISHDVGSRCNGTVTAEQRCLEQQKKLICCQ